MRILVAEDNPDNMEMLLRRLQRKGFEVHAVTNGKQAVNAVSFVNPDVILMDISMPIMSGLEAAMEIRKKEGDLSRVPIIALTAHAMESDKEKCLKAGCNEFATKPVDFSALLEMIMKLGSGEK